jgi:hypothetical protein
MEEISILFAIDAEHLLLNGLIEDAIELCRQGIKSYPDYASAYSILVRAYEEKGDLRNAIETINKAIIKFPNNKHFYSIKKNLDTAAGFHDVGIIKDEIITSSSTDRILEEDSTQLVEPEQLDNFELQNPEIIDIEPAVEEIPIQELNDTESSVEEKQNPEIIDIEPAVEEIPIQELNDTESPVEEKQIPEIIDIEPSVEEFEISDSINQNVSLYEEPKENFVSFEERWNNAPFFLGSKIISDNNKEILSNNNDSYLNDNKYFIGNFKNHIEHQRLKSELRANNLTLIPGLEQFSSNFQSKKSVFNNITITSLPKEPDYPQFLLKVLKKDSISVSSSINNNISEFQLEQIPENEHYFGELAKQLENARIQINNNEPNNDNIEIDEILSNEMKTEIYTETMAVIYEKQGAYIEAIKAYTALTEIYPEKTEYYKEKINYLNNKNPEYVT